MEQPQEPAWLRSYKTRAAPFTPIGTKAPNQSSTLSPIVKLGGEADVTKPEPQPEPQDHPNTYSVAFPSTISLGLHSFGQHNDIASQSHLHPALREVPNSAQGEKAASESSSTTFRVERESTHRSSKALEDRTTTGWRATIRRWVGKLGCDRN